MRGPDGSVGKFRCCFAVGLRQARRKLAGGEQAADERGEEAEPEAEVEREYAFDPERVVTRSAGRRGWLREADRQLEQQR